MTEQEAEFNVKLMHEREKGKAYEAETKSAENALETAVSETKVSNENHVVMDYAIVTMTAMKTFTSKSPAIVSLQSTAHHPRLATTFSRSHGRQADGCKLDCHVHLTSALNDTYLVGMR
jgi:hypothetical protein